MLVPHAGTKCVAMCITIAALQRHRGQFSALAVTLLDETWLLSAHIGTPLLQTTCQSRSTKIRAALMAGYVDTAYSAVTPNALLTRIG